MLIIVLITLLLISTITLLCDGLSESKSKILFYFIGLLLICVAGFRIGDRMPDYETYVGRYNEAISDNFSYFIEISFIYMAKLSNIIKSENSIVLFILYAILGVSLKMISIKNLSCLWFYSVIVYVSNYFILHEMIQIRAGVASGFILLSIVSIYNRQFIKFFVLIGLATLFHYSSIMFVLLWFLKPNEYKKTLYIILILFALLIQFIGLDIINFILGHLPFYKFDPTAFTYLGEQSTEINVYSIFVITRIVILIYFTYFLNRIEKYYKYIFILLKLYALGIFFYIAFSMYPVIAVRISYTLMATEIFIIPTLIFTIKGYYLPRLIVILYGLLAFLLNVYFTSYFNYQA